MGKYKCCKHCEPPCPLDGHKKACVDCYKSGNGNRLHDDGTGSNRRSWVSSGARLQ